MHPLTRAMKYVEHAMDCIEMRNDHEEEHPIILYLEHLLQKTHVCLLANEEAEYERDNADAYIAEAFDDE